MQFGDVNVEIGEDHVATVRFGRPPNNFFDVPMIRSLGDAFDALEDDPDARAILLCSEGRHFCAGAESCAVAGLSCCSSRRLRARSKASMTPLTPFLGSSLFT